MLKEIYTLLSKDIKLEIRQRYAFNAILLYVASVVLILSLIFSGKMKADVWNSLFWIIIMFSAINAVSKSFMQESQAKLYYYFSICSPRAILLSKIIYNTLLLTIIAIAVFIGFYFILPAPEIYNIAPFVLNILIAVIGFSGILTLVSAIAARTSNNFTLMAILSFPLMLPLLIINIKLSQSCLVSGFNDELLIFQSVLIDLVVIVLAMILYPYVWKE